MFLQSEVLSVSSISSTASRDYNQLGMESLLKLKKTYINRFEYEKAKMVQAVINKRKIEDIDGITQECKDKIDKKIQETELDLQRKRELIISKYKFKELDILEKIDNAFEIVQERHVEEMATIEKQKALGYVRAIHKPIKESRELLAQSKRLAENDDFDGAVRIREQSRKVKEEIIQNRKEQVNQKYELMRRQLYSKQKNDLKILQEKLKSALDKNESIKIETLKTHDNLARCTIILHQQKISGEMSQKIKSKDKKLAMLEQINKFFNQRIEQFNKKIEQANKEVLKSQLQSAQTSEVDFFTSGEESAITTDEINQINDEINNINADFENSSNTDNFSKDSNLNSQNNNYNDELILNNDSDNIYGDNFENNDFDAIDNNLQLDDNQTGEQNPQGEDGQIPGMQDPLQNNAEEESINSEQLQKNIISNSLQEEEEMHEGEVEIQKEEEEIQDDEVVMQNEEAEIQNGEAETQNDEAETQNEEAETQNEEAEIQNGEAEAQNEEAEIQNEEAEIQNGEAETQNDEYEIQNDEAEMQNDEAEIQNDEAEIQNEEEEDKQSEEAEMQNDEAETQNEEEEIQNDYEVKLNEEEEIQNEELNPSAKSDQSNLSAEMIEHQNQDEHQVADPSPDFYNNEPSNMENMNQSEQNTSASIKDDYPSLNQDE